MLRTLLPLAILASASAFQAPALAPHGLGTSRAASCRLNSLRMDSEVPEAMELSRRTFFKSVAGAGALTVGSLGLEVPQSFADGLPGVNSPAPDFSLPSNRGKNFSLKDLAGKWTVLYFYPGDFTSGCTIEAQNFEKNAAKIRGYGAEIVGVSVDSIEKHLDFEKQYGLSFPLLSDNGGKVSEAYGSALKIPFIGTFSNRQTYLIDPEGTLRWVFTGVQDRLAQHADEVAAKLDELTKA